jgi:hypothetical protein
MRSGWWFRLHGLRWAGAFGDRPWRRAVALLLWWVSSVVLPAAMIHDRQQAGQALDFLASLDIPLTLLLAAGVTLDAIAARSTADADRWLWPPAFRPPAARLMGRFAWLLVARWPGGLVLGTALLSVGAGPGRRAAGELYLMAALALVAGAMFMWMRGQRDRAGRRGSGAPRLARGRAALSWAPLHEARDGLDARRVALLLVPVMLAAPMNAQAGEVLRAMMLVVVAAFVVTVCRECFRIQNSLEAWLGRAVWVRGRIAFLVWRHVIVGLVVAASLLILWMAEARQLMDASR